MKYLSFLLLTFFFFSCGSGNSTASKDSDVSHNDSAKTDASSNKTSDAAKTDSGSTSKAASEGKWSYSDKEDKMTSKKKFFASIDANDLLDFDFPYDGGSTATITLRSAGEGNESMLEVSKGQFVGGIDGQTIKIRFDDEKPIVFSTSSANDGSSDVLFINNTKKLILKLKKAKKVIVQAEFYQAGFKEMEFDVAGLKWEH